ncbi:hypothetical protein BIX29_25895, partial [Salmonella enterica]|nr:hypothetical protein [Salmonella enterica]
VCGAGLADSGISECHSGGAPFVQRTERPPMNPPKTTDIKKPGNPFQDNRVNLTACFYNALRLTEAS